MQELREVFKFEVAEDPMVSFGKKVRVVMCAVLAVAFWMAALAMGWLMVLGMLGCHWAVFSAAEALTAFLAMSYTGQVINS